MLIIKSKAVRVLGVLLLSFSFGVFASPAKTKETKAVSDKIIAEKPEAKTNDALINGQASVRDSFIHTKAVSESWTFSGIVSDDSANRYGYSFLLLRQQDNFKVVSQIILLSTGKEVFHYVAEKKQNAFDSQGVNLKIKDAFLKYDEISDSWVFGINQKQGFNFRIEGNHKFEYQIEHIPGVSFYSLQGMRVNGQLALNDKSQFVTAKNAWLSHQWRDNLSNDYQITRVYCRLTQGKGLLLEQISQGDKRLFDSASLLEPNGKQDSVSQFVQLRQNKPDLWEINVLSPKIHLMVESVSPISLSGPYGNTQLYAGISQKAPEVDGSFCILSAATKSSQEP